MRLLFLIMILVIPLGLLAQRNVVLSDNIQTLTVYHNKEWNSVPYIELGTSDHLNITFDDLTHEYKRYRYRIEPMTWDWKVNERLLTSEFLSRGVGDEPIEDYEESFNTTVDYTHYEFCFPSSNCAVSLSGNYRLVVFDDDEDEDVLIIPFYVLENSSLISSEMTTNTDVDFNRSHQQLSFKLQPLPSLSVHYPETEIHTVVMQNLNPLTAVYDAEPDFVTPTGLEWVHAEELIFPASNEYHKFEMTTIRFGGMGIESIKWFDPYYHATLWTRKMASNYIFEEDKNGAFLIRNIDNDDSQLESEYVIVHFSVDAPQDIDGKIYVAGSFSNYEISDKYEMQYNEDSHSFECAVLLKQGYYNYRYVFQPNGSPQTFTKSPQTFTNKIDGDFYQTENRYTIFVYYSQRGSRYDRLIGIKDFQYMPSRR